MFLALKEFRHAKLRYALVTGVIVLVASLVFILSGLANGLAKGASEALEEIPTNQFVMAAGSEYMLDRSRLSPDVVASVQEETGVENAEPFSASMANIRTGASQDVLGVSVLAMPPGTFLDPPVSSGKRLADAPTGAVIDRSLVNDGVHLGDTITFDPSGVKLEVVGITEGHQYRLAPTVFVAPDTLIQINPELKSVVNAIAVKGDQQAIDALPSSIDGIMVGTTMDLVNGLPGYVEQNLTLSMIQGFLVVIAAGIIAAFFFILTLQKMSELGVMKALGATTGTLARALIIQSLILGVVGIVIGISVGDTVSYFAQGVVPYKVQWQQMILYGALLLLVAIGGTLLSLIRIAKVDPLDAINRVN